jgi:molecular chaperone GrpE
MKHKDRHNTGVEEVRPDDRAHADVEAVTDGSTEESTGSAVHKDEAAESTPDEVQAMTERVRTLEDGLLRAKADYQNLQRRTATERSEAIKYANADLMRSLVGVLDDFERALQSAEGSENLDAVVEGIRLVYENFRKALTDAGLETIDALHQPFDPSVHDALMQQPTEEHDPGTVVEQVAKGYRLSERVIRPAKVIVAKLPE